MNVTRMDSHGGWIASSSDLARFGTHVGGAPGVPSIDCDHDDARAGVFHVISGEICARLIGARQRQGLVA
jgi:hypothetical protein